MSSHAWWTKFWAKVLNGVAEAKDSAGSGVVRLEDGNKLEVIEAVENDEVAAEGAGTGSEVDALTAVVVVREGVEKEMGSNATRGGGEL